MMTVWCVYILEDGSLYSVASSPDVVATDLAEKGMGVVERVKPAGHSKWNPVTLDFEIAPEGGF